MNVTRPHPDATLKTFGDLQAWEWREDGVRKLELTGQGMLQEYETDALRGEFVDEDHYEIVVEEDTDIYKPRAVDLLSMFGAEETPEDRLLLSFRRGVIDADLLRETATMLWSAAGKSDNRGLAGGPVDVRKLRKAAQGGKLVPMGNRKTRVQYVLPDGSLSAVNVANRINSGLMGHFDADPRHQFCRQTSWTKANNRKTLEAVPFLEAVSRCFKAQAPIRWQRQKDFLVENGLVHRIASLNAFVGCNHPGEAHQGQFLICRSCQVSIELEQPAVHQAILDGASAVGFQVEGQTVEVVGQCAACRKQA